MIGSPESTEDSAINERRTGESIFARRRDPAATQFMSATTQLYEEFERLPVSARLPVSTRWIAGTIERRFSENSSL
jgi:hypothetical protein